MNFTILSVIPALFSISWSIILFYIGFCTRDQHKYLFSAIMAVLSIAYVGHILSFYEQYATYWMWESIHLFAELLVPSLFFVYMKKNIDRSKFSFSILLIFLPALIYFLISVILPFSTDYNESIIYLQQIIHEVDSSSIKWSNIQNLHKIKMGIYPFLFFLVSLISIISTQKLLNNYRKNDFIRPEAVEANVEKQIEHLQYLLILHFLLTTVFIILSRVYIVHSPLFVLSYSTLLGTTTFIIGVMGYKQNNRLLRENSHKAQCEVIGQTKIESEFVPEIDINHKRDHDKTMFIIKGKLIKVLEEDKIFRKKDLSLNDLAIMLGTNQTYVSKVINNMMNMTFDNLIDSYRVDCAKELLSSDLNNELLISDIVKQSGFASNSSFYRIFKRKTGTTPKKYKSNVIHSSNKIIG